MLSDTPVLETPRLLLRIPQERDLDRWAEFAAHEASARFVGGVQPRPVAWRGMASIVGSWALRGYGMFSVIERETSLWVGRIGPHCPEAWPGTEIGWGLHPDSTGKGYAVEAAVASMNFAVDVLGWTDLIHTIAPANRASQQVAERLGSTNRGPGKLPAPYENEPVEVWGQSAQAWKAQGRSI